MVPNRTTSCLLNNSFVGSPLVSLQTMHAIETIFLVILSGFVSLFGVLSNLVNLATFFRQGFNESITVGLTGLAVSDLCTVLSGAMIAVCFNPLIPFSELGVNIRELQSLVASIPRFCFARITGLITVYITLERCLCIAVPLHVKSILKPRRTLVVVLGIFALIFSIQLPVFLAHEIGWKFSPTLNKSQIGLIPRPHAAELENLTFVFGVCIQLGSFVVLIILTCTLVILLKKRSQWRATTTSTTTAASDKNNVSHKERNAIRLTIMVAAILICLTLPAAVLLITTFLEPEFNSGRRYQNLFFSAWPVVSFSEICNSSANIFVYYSMNKRYRDTFHAMFCRIDPPKSRTVDRP